MYLGLAFAEPLPLHYWRVRFASEFGWTFREFDQLSVRQFQETIGVLEGMEKARPTR